MIRRSTSSADPRNRSISSTQNAPSRAPVRIFDMSVPTAQSGSPARWQSVGAEPGADFWYQAGRVMNRQDLAPVPLAGTWFDNPVLGLTAAAAAAALAACGVDGQFLAEAVVLCLLGGALGILLGRAISTLAWYLLRAPVQTSLPAIIGAVGVSATVGIIFGFYPAWKASRLDPIEALRYE